MGINFIDTIVVRHTKERGTATEEKPVLPAEYMGKNTNKVNEDRLKLAGNLMIMANKGTKKINLSELEKPTLPADFKGHYISAGKGTKRIKI
ncbi:hypothetical protein Nisw_08750 [Candidatus Nitrosopumilus sp. SW]|uniref:hypothetical protein n=1 Tax=Candidatus Nitrosopumilus sp. SW TaxID=2508726 RepID=UPI00114D6FC9|nr:hypothetical protein [Candidatus Nitrosopumilus sp. SW]QDI89601.1 hypothetical protein Nisw_08750 [Candidatus Nitrosopumilus sp. SW]